MVGTKKTHLHCRPIRCSIGDHHRSSIVRISPLEFVGRNAVHPIHFRYSLTECALLWWSKCVRHSSWQIQKTVRVGHAVIRNRKQDGDDYRNVKHPFDRPKSSELRVVFQRRHAGQIQVLQPGIVQNLLELLSEVGVHVERRLGKDC